MSSTPASPGKQRGKWRFGKGSKQPSNHSQTSLDESKHSEAQSTASGQEALPASPSRQKKGFKLSLPKKALEKKKEKKKEEEQALNEKGSSHHNRSEFDMIGGLPPWENPTLMKDELTAPSHASTRRRAALNPTKPKKERNLQSQAKGSNRSTSSSSKKQTSSNMTLESLALNCDSSNSSISLEDIRCINLDGSSDGTQSFSIVSNKSSQSGTGCRRSNNQHEQRCNMSLPSVQRTCSGCSATSSTSKRPPRRTRTSSTNNPTVASSSKPPPSAAEGTAGSLHDRQQSLTNTMNASMNLGDIFGDDELKITIEDADGSVENNDSNYNNDNSNYNNDGEQEDELAARENEMFRLAMERSVNDFGGRSTSNGSGSPSRLYRAAFSSSASSAPTIKQLPVMPKRRTFGNMNQTSDLGEIVIEKSTGLGIGGGGGEEDLEEQERKMLEMAMQRSVQDMGFHSNSMMRPSRPSSRCSSTGNGTRHATLNMSMDLMSVFEEEPSEHMSTYQEADDDHRMIGEQQRNRYGSDSTGNYRADPSYGSDHRGRHQAPPGTSSAERTFEEGADARLLAQQEEEMFRLAMERSMQDFTLPPQSPRRSSDQDLYLRSASVGMVPNRHARSYSVDQEISSYSYSRPQRPNDPNSPQRSYSAGSRDDYGRRRDVRGGRRPRHPQPEPPSFHSNNFGELASVKEQEQEMFEQAIAMSKQEYRRASTSHYT